MPQALRATILTVALVATAACARFPEVTQAQAPFANSMAPPLAPLDQLIAASSEDRGAAAASAAGLRAVGAQGAAGDRNANTQRAESLRDTAKAQRTEDPSAEDETARLSALRARADALRTVP